MAVPAKPPRHRLLIAALLGSALGAFATLLPPQAAAQSALLESVKQNPQRAKALCAQLKGLNAQGLSYTARPAVEQIASQQGLSTTDAEILSTYVVGLYCPDVR
jgi:TctA family transporter